MNTNFKEKSWAVRSTVRLLLRKWYMGRELETAIITGSITLLIRFINAEFCRSQGNKIKFKTSIDPSQEFYSILQHIPHF